MRRPAWFADPLVPSLLLFAGLVVAGFAAVGIGWRLAARTLFVPFQIPALVSGALGGLALIMTGTALISIQLDRKASAADRASMDELLVEVSALVDERVSA